MDLIIVKVLEIKNENCKIHKINLIRIPYTFSESEVKGIILNIIQNPVTTIVA